MAEGLALPVNIDVISARLQVVQTPDCLLMSICYRLWYKFYFGSPLGPYGTGEPQWPRSEAGTLPADQKLGRLFRCQNGRTPMRRFTCGPRSSGKCVWR